MQKPGVMFLLLEGILQAVDEIDLKAASLDDILDDPEIIPAEMRRTGAYWLFSIFRYRIDIEDYIRKFAAKGKIKRSLFNLALAGIAHCCFQDHIAKELSVNAIVEFAKKKIGVSESRFINAILRKVCRENTVFSAKLPADLEKRWRKSYGNDFIVQARKCLASEPLQTFRVRSGFDIDMCGISGIADTELKHFTFYQTEKIDKVLASDVFADGGIYIQDSATAYSVELLKKYISVPEGKFVDVCGAPGGKAIMFHDIFPEWQIFIGDRSEKRHKRTQENLDRCKVKAQLLVADAAEDKFEEQYDVVFADVPCSNSGVFRKRPDALYRLTESALNEIVQIQRDILENICNAVSVGGLLLYSTCSIEEQEDNLQIADFCRRHAEFELLEERLLLPDENHDGAYSACLRRKK